MAVKLGTCIVKLYEETLENDFSVELSEDSLDVLKKCEENKTLAEYDRCFFAFAKTKKDDEDFIRMIFAMREGTKKVKNVERIVKLIKNVEDRLTYVNKCNIKYVEGFVYIDMLKEIVTE